MVTVSRLLHFEFEQILNPPALQLSTFSTLGTLLDALHTSCHLIQSFQQLCGVGTVARFTDDRLGLERIQTSPCSFYLRLVLKKKCFIL